MVGIGGGSRSGQFAALGRSPPCQVSVSVSWRVRLINPVPAFNKPFTVLIPFIHRVFNEVPGWQLPHAASKRITGQRQLGRFCREDPCRPPSARFSSLAWKRKKRSGSGGPNYRQPRCPCRCRQLPRATKVSVSNPDRNGVTSTGLDTGCTKGTSPQPKATTAGGNPLCHMKSIWRNRRYMHRMLAREGDNSGLSPRQVPCDT